MERTICQTANFAKEHLPEKILDTENYAAFCIYLIFETISPFSFCNLLDKSGSFALSVYYKMQCSQKNITK